MSDRPRSPRARRPGLGLRLLVLYGVLFLLSSLVRAFRQPPGVPPGSRSELLQAWDGGRRAAGPPTVRFVWMELAPEHPVGVPVVVLHGSPGRGQDMARLGRELARRRRVLLPDLPGFGRSSRHLPDYSVRADADYVLQLLERERVPQADVVAYSMGGGVGIELAHMAPGRVRSLTLLSSIGVQELELFGDHTLNHALHGLQLGFLWLLRETTPHFGFLDRALLGVTYARNFYDTDQRPLRGELLAWNGPALVVHGNDDPLVPFAAAAEHHRLLPQSELAILPGGHILPFTRPELVAAPIERFLAEVDAGRAPTRAQADPARVAASREPFDPSSVPQLGGIGLALFLLLAAASTLISEDLTCVAVGAFIGQGRIPFWPGTMACFVGIFVGDMLLFLAGRWLGRRALHRRPLSWVLDEGRVARSSEWFERRGAVVILSSRFLPGARLPTYFAAGLLRTRLVRFGLWFALAAGLWTPLLVWLSSLVGGQLGGRVGVFRHHLGAWLLATLALVLLVERILVPMLSHRGRRLLLSRWRRLTRWEFWPPWVFYPPVVVAALREALRERSLLVFTAANPGIPLGGFVGESKHAILQELGGAADLLPRTWLVRGTLAVDERLRAVEAFRAEHGLGLPLVVKPDVGQRGEGVVVARDEETLRRAVREARGDLLVQEHVEGAEFGLFYVRRPSEACGRLLSIAEKRLPFVVGDGRRTLERLILDDERAVCMARFFLRQHVARLDEVPAVGERIALGELGTHCRGALFLDACDLATPELEAAVDRLAFSFPGFCFGRFDVRAASSAELRAGRFRVLELNGVTSEAAHVYDPRHSVWTGWRTIAAQWRLAYAIGAENAARGAPVAGLGELVTALREFERRRRAGPSAPAPAAAPPRGEADPPAGPAALSAGSPQLPG